LILDKTETTLEARKEIFAIAGEIYPVDVFSTLKAEIDAYKEQKTISPIKGNKKNHPKEKKGFGFFKKNKK